jgi:dienelactone hydrolase
MKEGSWKIVHDGDACYLDYRLDDKDRVGDAYPALIIDGVIRDAELMSDQRTLRVSVSVADIHKIKDVVTPKLSLLRLRNPSARTPQPVDRSTWPTAPDPVSSGRYAVINQEYDFGDEALALPGVDAKVELRAAVYRPDTEAEQHPVVIFLHGMHQTCLGENGGIGVGWPCRIGESPLPSYQGYATAASALASHGYVVVSISANGISPIQLLGALPVGGTLRGHLVLAHLELLTEANKGNCPELSDLAGRLNLDAVGLMGHSRGGEGIARAITLNRLLNKGFGIRAAVFLGSTAREGIAVPDTHTATLLPFLDGDVQDLSGQMFPDLSRHAFSDDVLHSSVVLMGANHNYFNAAWSPGFPGGVDDAEQTWGDVDVARLSQVEQRALGAVYITGFFRLTLGKELDYLGLFDGSPVNVPGLPNAEVKSSAHFPSSTRHTIQSFETLYADDASSGSGHWRWEIVKGSGELKTKAAFGPDLRYAHDSYHSFLNLKSDLASGSAELMLQPPEGEEGLDPSLHTHLSFHVAHLLSENAEAGVELAIAINGKPLDLGQRDGELWPIPDVIPGVGTFLQQQVSVPLNASSTNLPDLVETVSFTLPRGGNIYLSDIAFVTPSLGHQRHFPLPFVSVEDVHIVPTGLEQVLEVHVTLSGTSLEIVSLRLYTLIVHTVEGVMRLETPLVFQPGDQSAIARFLIPAGGFKGERFDTDRFVSVIEVRALSNALFERERALLTMPRSSARVAG